MLKITVVIECNDCGILLECDKPHLANEEAMLDGWLCYGLQFHLCPNCQTDHIVDDLTNLSQQEYSEAMLLYWAVRPIIHPPVYREVLEKRVKALNSKIVARASKLEVEPREFAVDDLLQLRIIYNESPFNDWRAFVRSENEVIFPPIVEEAVANAIDDLFTSDADNFHLAEIYDQIVKQIAEDGGEVFPSHSELLARITRRASQ